MNVNLEPGTYANRDSTLSVRMLWAHRKQTVSLLNKEGFIITHNKTLEVGQFRGWLIQCFNNDVSRP